MSRGRRKSFRILMIVMLVSLNLIGISYASWNSDFNIFTEASTGSVDVNYSPCRTGDIENNSINICIGYFRNDGSIPVKLESSNTRGIFDYSIRFPKYIAVGESEPVYIDVHIKKREVINTISAESIDSTKQKIVCEEITVPTTLCIKRPTYIQANLWNERGSE